MLHQGRAQFAAPPTMVGQTCWFASISPPASAAMLAEPWGYARQNIAPLVLVEVWAARQRRPTLVVVSSCARPNQNKQGSSSLSKARKSACRGSLITNLKPPHDVFVPINSEELESKSVSDVVRPCPACSRSIGAAPPGMMAAQQRLSQNSVLLPPRPVRNERGED